MPLHEQQNNHALNSFMQQLVLAKTGSFTSPMLVQDNPKSPHQPDRKLSGMLNSSSRHSKEQPKCRSWGPPSPRKESSCCSSAGSHNSLKATNARMKNAMSLLAETGLLPNHPQQKPKRRNAMSMIHHDDDDLLRTHMAAAMPPPRPKRQVSSGKGSGGLETIFSGVESDNNQATILANVIATVEESDELVTFRWDKEPPSCRGTLEAKHSSEDFVAPPNLPQRQVSNPIIAALGNRRF
jgi:hypothetical protein